MAKYDSVIMDKSLKENISFLNHNLVTDRVFFAEVDLVMCRNVLIYFDRSLQDNVLKLFSESLGSGGVLCLGTKETIDYSSVRKDFFLNLDEHLRVYKKKPKHR